MNQRAACDKQLRSTITLIRTTMGRDDICHRFTDLDTDLRASFLGDCSIVFLSLQIADEVCSRTWRLNRRACLLNSRFIPFMSKKADRPLFQQTLQKSKQSGPGIAAVLLRPHVSHKGPPLLPPSFPSFNPNLNEAQTKRSCQWSARRGGLSREMKTCRRLQPNRLPVSKRPWQGATFLS